MRANAQPQRAHSSESASHKERIIAAVTSSPVETTISVVAPATAHSMRTDVPRPHALISITPPRCPSSERTARRNCVRNDARTGAAIGISNYQRDHAFRLVTGFDGEIFGDNNTRIELFYNVRSGQRYSFTMNDPTAGRSAVFGGIVSGGVAEPGLFRTVIDGPELITGGGFGIEASLASCLVCTATGTYLAYKAVQAGHVVLPFCSKPKAGEGLTLANA